MLDYLVMLVCIHVWESTILELTINVRKNGDTDE